MNSVEKRIALSAGDRLKSAGEHGQTLTSAPCESSPFEKYRGVLKRFRSRKEINAWVSEMRDEKKHYD